jgi:anion-transporting  ArsA/GET3 family ATPase
MGSEIDVLTAGPATTDPVPLLSSARLQELKGTLKDYDLIIFDTPPVLGTVDTLQIASVCSNTVLVARLDYLTQTELSQVSAQLNKLNILGIVANGAREIPHLSMGEQDHDLSSDSRHLPQPLVAQQSRLPQAQVLDEIPQEQLEKELNSRQNSLKRAVAFVQDQEKELEQQSETIQELKDLMQHAQPTMKEELRMQLAEEEERYRFLEKTLVGQRQNLKLREELIEQYQGILRRSKSDMEQYPVSDQAQTS